MLEPTCQQLAVRDAEEQTLLVLASAGCGKTEALAMRVAGLLERGVVEPPARVLVTTFSKRARDNIKERLQSYVSSAQLQRQVTVVNFHGLSARIYRAHANVLGLDADLTLPDSDWVLEQCRKLGLGPRDKDAVTELLRITKQQPLSDLEVEARLSQSGNQAAIDIERLRVQEGRLTYDDLPRIAELILANEVAADLYRHHFGYVVVDEFQDLTLQQLRIVTALGRDRTTYAGDLAQGIYGFSGAAPEQVYVEIRKICARTIELTESQRSSPAVLSMVNALTGYTGGATLVSAEPESWPSGGLAGTAHFVDSDQEADWVVDLAERVLLHAPNHRIGVVSRTRKRREPLDEAFKQSDLESHVWDDPLLDADTAQLVRKTLASLGSDSAAKPGWRAQVVDLAELDSVQDPYLRGDVLEALGWVCDLLEDGVAPEKIRTRIKVGSATSVLQLPGVHLLTGHVGKGQQFDWVVVAGAEEGTLPFFLAKSEAEINEEARVFSVMMSRARHGVIVTSASRVSGNPYQKQVSRFIPPLQAAGAISAQRTVQWIREADWPAIAAK